MLTSNISREEMLCKCGQCDFDVADWELLTVVQDCADFFKHRDKADKVMIVVTSGNRCPKHNHHIGGAPNSQHQYGKALDFKLKTFVNGEWRFIGAHEITEFLDSKYPEKYGIGQYSKGRVHLDCRPTKARWRG